MRLTQQTIALLTLLTLPPLTHPQAEPADAGAASGGAVRVLEEITVTATRTPEPVLTVPASLTAIGRPLLEQRGATYIGDELAGLPGVTLQRNDAGTYSSVILRGVPNRIHNDTLLALVDGVPMVTADGEVDLEQVAYDSIGRVDLIRGPVSSQYGRGAIAGAIHYQTREIPAATGGSAAVKFGSYGFRRAEADLGLGGSAVIVASTERGDGWRDRTGRRQETLFGKGRIDLGERTTLTLWVSHLATDQHLAGELPIDAAGNLVELPSPRGRRANFNEDDARFVKRVNMATATLDSEVADGLVATTRVSFRHADTTANQGFFRGYDAATQLISFTGFSVRGDDRTGFAEQQIVWKTERNRLVAGLSAERIRGRHVETWSGEFDFGALFYTKRLGAQTGAYINQADWLTDRLLDAGSRETVLSAYAEDEFRFNDWARLTVGARFDRFQRNVAYGPSASGYGPNPETTASDADHRVSPKAALSVRLAPGVESYVSYGTGFSPGFGPVWSFKDRPVNLAPETARNYELGLKAALPEYGLSASAALYRLERRNLIQLITDGPSARTVNAGEQRSDGFELEASWRQGDWTLSANYGWTRARWIDDRFFDPDLGRDFDFSGKRVAGVPAHSGSAGVERRIPSVGLTLYGWVEAAGDYWIDNPNSARAGGKALLHANATWVPPGFDRLELQASMRNLLDRRYAQLVGGNLGPTAGFPGSPREAFLQAKVRF